MTHWISNSVRLQRRQPTRLPHPWDCPGKNTGVGCHLLLQCMKVKSKSEVAQSCPTPSNPMDCSQPGSSIHGICQARVLEWVAIAFSLTALGVVKTTVYGAFHCGAKRSFPVTDPHLIPRHKFVNLFPKREWHPFLYKLSYLIYYLTQLFHLL